MSIMDQQQHFMGNTLTVEKGDFMKGTLVLQNGSAFSSKTSASMLLVDDQRFARMRNY